MALVVWSGGCDSTLVLYDVAREFGKACALSIVHPQILAQEESASAREKLLSRLRKMKLNVDHSTLTMSHDNGAVEAVQPDYGLVQPLIWLTAAVAYLETDEDLYFGYHAGDDFWHFRQPFEAAFQALQRVRGAKGKLRFPLEWQTKAGIVKRLQALKLYNPCWYCENPRNNKACRKCQPCIVHRTAVWQIAEGLA